jgi:hypothetical protein
VWLAESLATGGETRGWIEGLAMIAEGMLALEERRVRSAERLLTRGRWMLSAAPDRLGEIDLVAARAAADEVVAALCLGDLVVGPSHSEYGGVTAAFRDQVIRRAD